ncbi:hypothetical protein [Streptomyces sp. LMG1-1-1.1]|uniref:hypothetical protein n=1 Tax=Streptomyces sp. LMG1-1-1.1 TaxID=3135245 RepID=UPI003465444E
MMAWLMGSFMPFGVVAIVRGVAAFRTGWMIAPARRSVRRPRVYGVGVVMAGTGVLVAGATYFALAEAGALSDHPWFALVGNGVELAGIAFIAASRWAPRPVRAARPSRGAHPTA